MIDRSSALLNSGYKLREMRRGREGGREGADEDEDGAQWRGLHVRLIEVNMDLNWA